MKQSPEITGAWNCPAPGCGNRTHFIGTDSDGYGGPEVCECEASAVGAHDGLECLCSTELVQELFIRDGATTDGYDGEIDYQAFTGGGSGAEIGSYDTIVCGECGALVWSEEPTDD